MPDDINALSISSPYVALYLSWRHIYWDDIFEYWVLFLSVGFYLGTTILAVTVAKRREFHRYALKFVSNARTALCGCVLCWLFAFPYFLHNWKLVSSGKAPLRKENSRGNGGIYTIATIVAMFWMILLAMAIPSMIQSPIRANQAMAVTSLKNYATAQITFDVKKAAQVRGNTGKGSGYCDNFRNLYYGLDAEGKRLKLISCSMADAFAGPASGAPTPDEASEKAVPFHDYLFLEDPYVVENRLWKDDFALIAYPARPWRDAFNMFWINSKGIVLQRKCAKGPHTFLSPEQSPLHPEGRKLWQEL